jgi:Alginate export
LHRRLWIPWALCVWAGLPPTVLGQAPERTEPPQDPALEGSKAEQPRARLPAWLKLGVELRGRAESNNGFEGASSEPLYLNRLRLNAGFQPAPWMRFFVQAQDARAFSRDPDHEEESLRNTLDLRQAYVDFGRVEAGWQLRAGRQELAVGDERLVGADNYWDGFGQAFDAVLLGFTGARFRVDAFTRFRVQPSRRSLDPSDTASRIAGLTLQFKTRGAGVLEPYFLWKRGGDTGDLLEHPGHRDVLTPGVRAQGALPHSLDYNIEMALQRGHVVDERISAWAGHWELGWKPLGKDSGLRLGLEYNFASGDRDLADGKHGTFDDLYPAGFNKCGMADPIAWRNIRYPAVGVEVPLTRRWTVYGGYRNFRLATVHDGLYPGGDEYLARNPAATRADVGSHVLASAGYAHSDHWKAYAGYGYLFPGAYLRQSGYLTAIRTAYLLFSFAF